MSILASVLEDTLKQDITARVKLLDYKQNEIFSSHLGSYSVYELKGESSVSRPYTFTLTFVSDEEINVEDIVDTDAQLILRDSDNSLNRKEIYGKIFSACENSIVSRKKLYTIEIVSPLHYLSLNRRYQIFQEKTASDIISEVISRYGSLLNLELTVKLDQLAFPKRETCTQYGQSDLDFIIMLCEEEGLSLICEYNSNEPYTLSLCELNEHSIKTQTPCKCSYNLSKEFVVSSHKQAFYDENRPALDMSLQTGQTQISPSLRDNEKTAELRTSLYTQVQRDRLEILDESIYKDLNRYAQIDAVSSESSSYFINGISYDLFLNDCMSLELKNIKAHKNIHALILSVRYEGKFPNALDEHVEAVDADEKEANYKVEFTAIPSEVIYKPNKITPKPKIYSSLSAIVSNKESNTKRYANEIDVDEKGRIRVLFHFDENRPTSVYVRLASFFSGDNYGSQFIPRVNSEVVVDFINGDIDRPVITGALHNGENRQPYTLPKNKTQSFIKTQTTPQYEDKEGYNELLFEDRANNEELRLRAQNDYSLHVLNDEKIHIENNSKTIIGTDAKLTVAKNLKESIGKNSRTNIQGKNHLSTNKDHLTTVKEDNETAYQKDNLSIIKENQTNIIKEELIQRIKGTVTKYVEKDKREKYLQSLFSQIGADLGIDVTGAFSIKAESIKETAKTIELDGADGISLKCGANTLTVDASGIHFKTAAYSANSGNAGVTSAPVNIKDLAKPLYQKIRVTALEANLSKQENIKDELIYTAKVQRYENGEWKDTKDLNPSQELQLQWYFIKNNDKSDDDIISDNTTDDEIEINGLTMRVKVQDDNIDQFAHVHCFVASPEDEDGYVVTELKRFIEVEEIKGHSFVEKNDLLAYDIVFNVENITDAERNEFIAEVIEIEKDDTQKSTKYEIEKDLMIKHPLEKEKVLKKILVQATKKEGK